MNTHNTTTNNTTDNRAYSYAKYRESANKHKSVSIPLSVYRAIFGNEQPEPTVTIKSARFIAKYREYILKREIVNLNTNKSLYVQYWDLNTQSYVAFDIITKYDLYRAYARYKASLFKAYENSAYGLTIHAHIVTKGSTVGIYLGTSPVYTEYESVFNRHYGYTRPTAYWDGDTDLLREYQQTVWSGIVKSAKKGDE